MLIDILRFEWRYHSRQAAFLAASLLFLLLGFAFSGTQFGPDNVAVNSPYLVMEGFALLSLAGLIAASIFAAGAVLRDDDHRMSEIIHTTPVGRLRYLLGQDGAQRAVGRLDVEVLDTEQVRSRTASTQLASTSSRYRPSPASRCTTTSLLRSWRPSQQSHSPAWGWPPAPSCPGSSRSVSR